ncbi:MAG: histidine--tRNA ligase [Candidatus Marsarchaeota archaeon]|nr:histidine--tRNA ligase [Candidatus Marsarchaeota archaeon]MCL5111996.1 histidine--tRNA ligase [Candidatus Marsarchaeota archaeon]
MYIKKEADVEMRVVKGTKDYMPAEQSVREMIRSTLVDTFKLYNFGPLETPILEYYDILASKYAGGAEILKETYSLTDQANRKLGLRYDLTVPFSRVIAMNQNMRMPFKRWEIGKAFRNGPIKFGRYREFTQCDVDVVGIDSMAADAELISMATMVFKRLGIDVYLEVNNMKVLSGVLTQAGVEKENIKSAILTVDKLKKIGAAGVKEELISKGIKDIDFDMLFKVLSEADKNEQAIERIRETITNKTCLDGLNEIEELFKYIRKFSVNSEVKFIPSLARGLGFYTSTIFEVYAKDSKMTSSVAGGGRYDDIIKKFLNSEKNYPAVGISFGLEAIYDTLMDLGKVTSRDMNLVKAYVIAINNIDYAIPIVAKLREAGITADVNYLNKKLKKELEYASDMKIPFVIIVGDREAKENVGTLRDMDSKEQISMPINKIIERILRR